MCLDTILFDITKKSFDFHTMRHYNRHIKLFKYNFRSFLQVSLSRRQQRLDPERNRRIFTTGQSQTYWAGFLFFEAKQN